MPDQDIEMSNKRKQRYYNQEPKGRSLKAFLKWRLTRVTPQWPTWIDIQPELTPVNRVIATKELLVTYINHATVLIQTAGLNILTDPIWSQRCSPLQWLGPKRIHAPGIALENLPPIDAVLISHNHYDHLDLPTIAALNKRFKSQFITGLGNKKIIHKASNDIFSLEMDWWETITISDQVKLTYVPAHHWSGRGVLDTNTCLWGGFVIETPQHTIYFAGDTAYGKHFEQIQQRFGEISLAILPIGAYEVRWFMQETHINPEEAVIAHQQLNAKYSLGIHFGTFADLADEAYEQPLTDLSIALTKHDIDPLLFRTLKPGEGWMIQ